MQLKFEAVMGLCFIECSFDIRVELHIIALLLMSY